MNDDWELLMPFVICTSQGGPFDDEAFVAPATSSDASTSSWR